MWLPMAPDLLWPLWLTEWSGRSLLSVSRMDTAVPSGQMPDCSRNESSLSDSVLVAEDIAYSVVIPTICAIGIPLNAINLVVFLQGALTGPCFTLLTALSLADMTTLLIMMPIGLSRRVDQDSVPRAAKLYDVYVFQPLGNTSATISIWVTTTLTVERLVSVRKYALASKTNTVLRARIIVLLLSLASLVLHIPCFFYREVSVEEVIRYTPLAYTSGWTVYSWLRFALTKAIPCLAIVIFNSFLIYEVWQSHKRRKMLVQQQSGEAMRMRYQVRLTIMLICVSAGFMIGQVPEAFSQPGVVMSMVGYCALYTDEYKVYRLVTNCLEATSYAYHFVVYMACNQQFRQVLKRTILCYRCRKVGDSSNKVWPVSTLQKPQTS